MNSIASSGVPIKARSAVTERRSPRRRFDHGQPIWKPNYSLTVLIWAFLVIMILATLRPQTHALLVDLPPLDIAPLQAGALDRPSHIIGVGEDGTLLWNGEQVDQAGLLERVQFTLAEPVAPVFVFAPSANASYEMSLKALAILQLAGAANTEFCFGNLGQHKDFGSEYRGANQFALLSVAVPSVTIEQGICDHFAADSLC